LSYRISVYSSFVVLEAWPRLRGSWRATHEGLGLGLGLAPQVLALALALRENLAKARLFPHSETKKSCFEQSNAWYGVVPICLDTV